jgi:hypothetical protein
MGNMEEEIPFVSDGRSLICNSASSTIPGNGATLADRFSKEG